MFNNPKRTYLIAFVAALALAFLVRLLYYYPGPLRIDREHSLVHQVASFYKSPQVAESTPVPIESLASRNPVPSVENAQGRAVVVDMAHDNSFSVDELSSFTGSLASDGAQILYAHDSSELASDLPEADSLIVIAPGAPFETDEIRQINQFVGKGGHLILVGEPTRQTSVDAINSLSGGFGVIYQDAYIYNLRSNDAGYRNVVMTKFADDSPITKGAKEVVFQTAYALRTDEANGVIFGDDQTYSSREEQPGGVIAVALADEGRVLALPDFTFFTSPYDSFADNEVLLGNVAAFALTGARGFDLTDFPFFFDGQTDIVYQNPVTLNKTFADSVALRTSLAGAGKNASLAEKINQKNGFIYVSLYDDASPDVLSLLKSDGITISDEPLSREGDGGDGTISIEGVAQLDRTDTAFLYVLQPKADSTSRSESAKYYRLVILASSEEDLSAGISLLLSGGLDPCLVNTSTAICNSDALGSAPESIGTEEPPTPSEGGGTGTILVVDDNQGLTGPQGDSSASTVADILSGQGITVETIHILDDGSPDVGTLEGFDAVFWMSGDYCCKTPSEDAAAALQEYVAGGGKLFIAGMFIATDWGSTDFLNETLSAELDGYGPQLDMEPSNESHPLSDGFSGTITFRDDVASVQPDVIQPLNKAVTVFVRGPASDRAGEPTLIAYEDGSTKVGYAAFPLFLIQDSDLSQLIGNVVNWFASN